MTTIELPGFVSEARNATMDDLLTILRDQHARKIDAVVPATNLRFDDAQLQVKGVEPLIENDGVTEVNGTYRPTDIFDEKLAGYLNIPLSYLRRLRAQRPDLYDANANGWLLGRRVLRRRITDEEAVADIGRDQYHYDEGGWGWATVREAVPPDPRSFLLRLFRGEENESGVGRVILSNRYKTMDHLDGLMALMSGLKESGIDPEGLRFERCDLTERRLYVKVSAPEIRALAPELLKGYRNPFAHGAERAERMIRGRDIDDWRRIAADEGMAYSEEEGGEPVVFAGLLFANSETGHGMWTVTPQITIQICRNGLTFTEDAFGKRHVGSVMDDGVIDWGDDTQDANLELVRLQTRDMVKQFLDVSYVERKVAQLEELAGVKVSKPEQAIKAISKKLAFTDEQAAGILEHFVLAGQLSAGGVLNAITSYSQTVLDADEAHGLDAKAVRALALAAS